jgi:hypothetical protein
VGFWAYDVPEFKVTHYGTAKEFTWHRSKFAGAHDIIIREDYKCYGEIVGDADIPLCYYAVDSPASEDHYQRRCRVANGSDLILVEQDRLERFAHLGAEVRRFGYCVNDRFFRDYGLPKTTDVGMYYMPTPGREKLNEWLTGFCGKRGYVYRKGKRIPGDSYPRAFNKSKISVNLSFNENCRPHRVFDAMACRSCLVTNPLPDVSGEAREVGFHYLEFEDHDHLGRVIDDLLTTGLWKEISDAAYDLVMERHTWKTRAGELRETLYEVFGL